jgi:two-component system sensor histidine kinase KdpD
VLYVQTDSENSERIPLATQRHLINNFKLATQLGAEVLNVKNNSIANSIVKAAEEHNITTICIGKPHLRLFKIIMSTAVFNQLLNKLSASDIDIIILS